MKWVLRFAGWCCVATMMAVTTWGCKPSAAMAEAKAPAGLHGPMAASPEAALADEADYGEQAAAEEAAPEPSPAMEPPPAPPPEPQAMGGTAKRALALGPPPSRSPSGRLEGGDASNPDPQHADATDPSVDVEKASATSAQRHPLLIYTAHVVMAVFEATKAIDAVERLARKQGGYLVRRSDEDITIRVPADRFDGSLEQLKALGDELHRQVNVQDVTAEFNDLTIQLKNLRAMRDRFEQLLKRAVSVQDALAIERELQRVLGQIERIQGRLKVLRELLAYSTITVRFQARPVDKVRSRIDLPFPWLRQLGLPELLDL